MKQLQTIVCIIMALALAACNQSLALKVDTDIPAPLVVKLPLTMGIYYDKSFRHYAYEEDSEDRPDWAINSGESQVFLFDQIFSSMFQQTQAVDSQAANALVDGILKPEVVEMQFALPTETKTEFYESWLKYKISLYDNKGDFVADWPVTGYGKSSATFLKSRDKSLNAAINQALRDVGAKLAIGFPHVAGVDSWLEDHQSN